MKNEQGSRRFKQAIRYLGYARNYAALLACMNIGAANLAQAQIATPSKTVSAPKAAVKTEASGEAKSMLHWTCDAVIQLIGTGISWAPPTWPMSGGLFVDREKQCFNFLKTNFLDDGEIWVHIKSQLSAAQQDQICRAGRGQFRVDYGFDKRAKDWSQTLWVTAPPCNCPSTCPDGYHLSGNGNCAKGMCQTGALPNQSYFQNGQGHFIWNGTLYHQVAPTSAGQCSFK